MQAGTTKIIAIVVAIVIVVAGVAVFFTMRNNGEDTTLYEIEDAAGNRIKLDTVPERIVSLDARTTEILCELGLTSNLVGVTSDAGVHDVTDFIYGFDFDIGYPTELLSQIASGKTKLVGPVMSWTTDNVLNSNPDLVVFQDSANNMTKMKMLQEMNITCLVLSGTYDSVEVIYENMELAGKALGKSDRAELFNNTMKDIVDYIYKTCNGFKQKDVIMISAPGAALYAYASSNLKHVVLRDLGCTTKMAGQVTGIVTVENVLNFQPDVIILDPMGMTMDMSNLKKQFEADPLWADTVAMKNNNIYYLEYASYQATGYTTHHFVHGIALMATIVFDELGVDVPQLVEGDKHLSYITWLDKKD